MKTGDPSLTATTRTVAPPPATPGSALALGTPPSMSCFVIGPIGDRDAEVDSPELAAYEDSLEIFEKVIGPACSRLGITAVRADQLAHAGELTEQICRHVLEDDLVIADVSGGNPNVLYELGLRHASGKPVIHIGERGRLPFDIAPVRTVLIKRTATGLISARKELEKLIGHGVANGFEQLTPARILRGSSAPATDPEADDSPRLIELLSRAEDQMSAMTADMEAITAAIESFSNESVAFGDELEKTNRPGTPSSARLAAVARYAKAISPPTTALRRGAGRLAQKIDGIDAMFVGILEFIQNAPPGLEFPEWNTMVEQFTGTSAGIRSGLEALQLFATTAKWMATMSRELRGPADDILVAVRELSSAVERIGQWEERFPKF